MTELVYIYEKLLYSRITQKYMPME